MTSGKHRGPRYLLTFHDESQRTEWQTAAAWKLMTLAEWIRQVCDQAARDSAFDHHGKDPRRKG